MILGKVGQPINEDFTVIDNGNNLVTGLNNLSFTRKLYDSSGNDVTSSISVVITELGNGNYRAAFSPSSIGIWYLAIYHDTYFPWGKSDTIQVFNNDFDTMEAILTRIVGLTQENHYIDNTSYDGEDNLTSCRIRLYDDSTKVGSDSNVTSTYLVTAGYTDNLLDFYKVVKQ